MKTRLPSTGKSIEVAVSLVRTHWVAVNLEALDRDDDAINLLRVLTEDDKRAEPLVSLGDLLRSNKRFMESLLLTTARSNCYPCSKRHWSILYSRGISLERSAVGTRERDFQHALELNPISPTFSTISDIPGDQGINLDQARKMIERAVKLRPNDGYIVDSLGWVLYRLRDFEGAVGNLERAVELRPNDPTINDHLGDDTAGRTLRSAFNGSGLSRQMTLNFRHRRQVAPRSDDV